METPELIERHFGKVADFHLSPRFWTPPPPWSKSFNWFQFVIILELMLLSPQILCAPQRHPPDLKPQRRRTLDLAATPPDPCRATGRAVPQSCRRSAGYTGMLL
jgi:hypothetical protein